MRAGTRRSLLVLLTTAILGVGCGTAAPSQTPITPSPTQTPASAVPSIAPSISPATSVLPTPSAVAPTPVSTPAQSCPPPQLDTGWPTACRDGITLTASFGDDPTVADGMGAAPHVPLEIRLTGLSPGEAVSLRAVATYRIGVLGCGRTPSVCYPGSGGVGVGTLCAPIYAEQATGSSRAAVAAVAATDGTAAATVRLPIIQTRRPCPADPSLPWYQRSAEWTGIRVADPAHRISVTLPDWIIGP